jgi:hypothetical protein
MQREGNGMASTSGPEPRRTYLEASIEPIGRKFREPCPDLPASTCIADRFLSMVV